MTVYSRSEGPLSDGGLEPKSRKGELTKLDMVIAMLRSQCLAVSRKTFSVKSILQGQGPTRCLTFLSLRTRDSVPWYEAVVKKRKLRIWLLPAAKGES